MIKPFILLTVSLTVFAAAPYQVSNSQLKEQKEMAHVGEKMVECDDMEMALAVFSMRYRVIMCEKPNGAMVMFVDDELGVRHVAALGRRSQWICVRSMTATKEKVPFCSAKYEDRAKGVIK